MKKIKVGNTFACVDDEDFDFLNQFSWKLHYKGYAHASIKMHRLVIPVSKDLQVDHKDWVKLNNQKNNLRQCTNAQNQQHNARGNINKNGYKGISYNAEYPFNPWIARIGINKKRIYLGSYPTKELAAKAYNDAAKKYFGEFASLNEI